MKMAASSFLRFTEKELLAWFSAMQTSIMQKEGEACHSGQQFQDASDRQVRNEKGRQFTLLKRITNSKM
jgi:hypothetical protein